MDKKGVHNWGKNRVLRGVSHCCRTIFFYLTYFVVFFFLVSWSTKTTHERAMVQKQKLLYMENMLNKMFDECTCTYVCTDTNPCRET